MKSNMPSYKTLLQHEQEWVTDIGAWFPGERVVLRGKDIFSELKDMPWMEMLLYGITGRRFTEKQIKLFESIWVISTSYPDPRLWNNRIAALAATTRSTTVLGISAGTAISEATVYGSRPIVAAFDFLHNVEKRLESGESLSAVLQDSYTSSKNTAGSSGSGLERRIASIPGYGRPVINKDERISNLLDMASELGCSDGQYAKLATKIEQVLIDEKYSLRMNVGALIAALSADQGLSFKELNSYCVLCFSGGMFPCYLDALAKPEGAFFPLRCDRIQYKGKPKRKWKKQK